MRKYCKLSDIPSDLLKEIWMYLFNICDKVNIYFPNEASLDVLDFKNTFLKTIDIMDIPPDFVSDEDMFEEKEGYSMVIASLTEEIQKLILNKCATLNLSFGLISQEKVLFYMSDTGECILEDDEDSSLFSNPLFSAFTLI